MWHDSCICETWLIHMWHDSFIRETWLIHMWHDSFIREKWLIHMWHDSFIRETWLIHMWHDSFIRETWLFHMWHDSLICETWLIYMWHDSCICETWLSCICNVPIHITPPTNESRTTCRSLSTPPFISLHIQTSHELPADLSRRPHSYHSTYKWVTNYLPISLDAPIHVTPHTNESRTTGQSLSSLQSYHAIRTTYEWATNST